MNEIDYHLLGKILSGEATQKENAIFHEWLEQSDENKEIYEAYRFFYQNTSIKESDSIPFMYKVKAKQTSPTWTPTLQKWSYWAAASVVFLFLFFLFADRFNKPSEPQVDVNKIVSFSNPKGKKSKILLPDSSVVWLNSDSKLEYPENFTDSLREIKLTGEAFFEVTKDSLRPFIVDIGALKTTVLGTSFNICSYPDDNIAAIALASGKLSVEQEDNKEILLPGNEIDFNKTKNKLNRKNIDISSIAIWKNGILTFEKEDFQSVVARLERWYDVEITLNSDPSPEWRFTGYFDNEYLSNVLKVLCYGKNLDYKIEGQHVKITRQ